MTTQPTITELEDLYDVPPLADGEGILKQGGVLTAAALVKTNDVRLTDQRVPPDGSVTIAKLSFDPATQVELNDEISARAAADSILQADIDAVAAGLRFKDTVRVAVSTNVTVADPGTATIDGVMLASGDTLLLYGQTAPAENGAYVFNGADVPLTRRPDSDTSGEVKAGTTYPVTEGSHADHLAILTTDAPIVVGTTELAFTVLAQASDLVAGAGLNRSGLTLSIPAGAVTSSMIVDGTIVDADVAADTLTARVIAANAVGASELADGAVDTAAILDGAITAPKFAAGAVQAALGGSQPYNNARVVAMGDSETFNFTGGPSRFGLQLAGRGVWGGIYATQGYTVENVRDVELPLVLALTGWQKPAAAMLLAGTNNVGANSGGGVGTGFDFTAAKAAYLTIVNSLWAAKIVPIICTIPPRTDATLANTNVRQWNVWLVGLAASMGFPLVDYWSTVIKTADGTWAASMTADNIHFNGAANGVAALAAKPVLAAVLPQGSMPYVSKHVGDLQNLMASFGQLFLGAATNGVAGNWGGSGTGCVFTVIKGAARTVSDGVTNATTTITSATAVFTAGDVGKLVTGSADLPAGVKIASVTNSTTAVLTIACTGSNTAQTFTIAGDTSISGNWQTLSRPLAASANAFLHTSVTTTTGFSVGDRLAISCIYQTSAFSTNTSQAGYIYLTCRDVGNATLATANPVASVACDIATNSLAYDEIVVPVGTTNLDFGAGINGAATTTNGALLQIAQFTIINLTTLGLA